MRCALLCKLAAYIALVSLGACTYLHYVQVQDSYARRQSTVPLQRTYKHLLDTPNYFVFGRLSGKTRVTPNALAVIAVADHFKRNEVVDINTLGRIDSYYGMNLPPGNYKLLVAVDENGDGYFDSSEVIAERDLALAAAESTSKVLGDVDIRLDGRQQESSFSPPVPVPKQTHVVESAVYPNGTIRKLDDPLFAPDLAELGMYEPAAFLERAPMMFYALEEDVAYKVPVVFVHGITGSPRDFAYVIQRLDRRLYRPWFFYYPGGTNLAQLSDFFHRIFLSGQVIPLRGMPMVIVAHSMGGLIVRDALNRYDPGQGGPSSVRLITIASPLGGMPTAAAARSAPLAVPSWLDLIPGSSFLKQLHRQSLGAIEYDLVYTRGRPKSSYRRRGTDGTVPIASQLDPAARGEATHTYGFDADHMGVLSDEGAVSRILASIQSVEPPFSDQQLAMLLKGGFDPPQHSEAYTPLEKHLIQSEGYFMQALAEGTLAPENPAQAHFVEVVREGAQPTNEAERAWLKFRNERR